MRQLASFLLFALALPAVAADAWRWKDDKGVVHYSDTPVPGAERVVLPSPPTIGTVVTAAPKPPVSPPEPFKYNECVVVAPGNDQTFRAVTQVTAALRISPPLQRGDRIQVVLDGDVYAAWPAGMLTFKLENLYRGTHTLSVLVLGADKKPLCTGPHIAFHVQQASILAPARPKAKP